MGSRRMLFPNCGASGSEEMASSRAPPGVSDLGLGLQSLRLSGWDRPWSNQDTDASSSQVQTSSPSSEYLSSSPSVKTLKSDSLKTAQMLSLLCFICVASF